ncbi:DUF3238 domain-containing protein [Lysobacter arenosi]|uniref:DUF3238 domain-containing protein n=1 Tax=Lysobacter arenosi TaxID=2795387 RepID=A0ABX7R9F0_9GAMM|nr:DUF3238 domain-containing protein [Lysobacter arenosi]QSX73999.1 DUF3238 domain-containing protein [Lysobacter arenosi]
MSIKIWIASFIPRQIDGYTHPVPGGGTTMIPGPTTLSDCFLTDQRSFSSSPNASSRTRSLVEVNLGSPQPVSVVHHCDSTVEVDCEDGEIECNQTPDSSGLKITNFSSTATRCTFTFEGGAGNPCAGPLAPDIDWLVHVVVERSGDTVTVKIGTGSLVEPFPAFECYASVGGTTKALFQRPPDPAATPWDLPGAPNKTVTGSVAFP